MAPYKPPKESGSKNSLILVILPFSPTPKKVVAYSPALDIATSGKNEKEASKRFAELVMIFFEELKEMGTTDDVLSELGWHKQKISTLRWL